MGVEAEALGLSKGVRLSSASAATKRRR